MVTVLPGAKLVPSVVDTLIRSFDSSEWNVPDAPSAQESLIVLGWLGSGPRLARPRSSDAPESHERPTVVQDGACRAASKLANRSLPPPAGLTVSEMLADRVFAPLVPWAWMVKLPVVAPAVAAMVRVVLAVPFAGGVTEAGLYEQLAPEGRLAQPRVTALLKPLVEVTVQVVLLLEPWVTVTLDGLQLIEKSGVADATGVTVAQLLTRLKQALDAP